MSAKDPSRSLGRRAEDEETLTLLTRTGKALLENRWILGMIGAALLAFVAIPNPLNKFTRLEGQIRRDSAFTVGRVLDLDLKIAGVEHSADTTRRYVESMMIFQCLQPELKLDLQKSKYPCAFLFQKHGIAP